MEKSNTNLGQLMMSRGINNRIQEDELFNRFLDRCLFKYMDCDWGETDKSDAKENDKALDSGDGRIFASYIYDKTGEKIWIITESDKSATTILFPDEY